MSLGSIRSMLATGLMCNSIYFFEGGHGVLVLSNIISLIPSIPKPKNPCDFASSQSPIVSNNHLQSPLLGKQLFNIPKRDFPRPNGLVGRQGPLVRCVPFLPPKSGRNVLKCVDSSGWYWNVLLVGWIFSWIISPLENSVYVGYVPQIGLYI